MSKPDGFKKYQRFFERAPSLVVEWTDDKTDAQGWLCIDSLRGGAAGGGTRMRDAGSREEAVFLAKTMGVKFRVCGPEIGGGKSVIRFDPHARPKEKRGVLERWYTHIAPLLRECYGTGGDVNVDEVSEATAITSQVAGISHPQEGICRGHMTRIDGEKVEPKTKRLKSGCEALVTLPDLPGPREGGAWTIADVVTGYGVARSLEHYYERRGMPIAGQRVVVEGFGAVGAFAAYYLGKVGAKLVATSTRGADGFRVAIAEEGLDIPGLIAGRDGTHLGKPRKTSPIFKSEDAAEIYDIEADIFVPAAASHTVDAKRIKQLRKAGVRVWSCGANNPFSYKTKNHDIVKWVEEMSDLQRKADKHFAIIPDFVANCGMARTFAHLMVPGNKATAKAVLDDIEATMNAAVKRLVSTSRSAKTGLLDCGYQLFID